MATSHGAGAWPVRLQQVGYEVGRLWVDQYWAYTRPADLPKFRSPPVSEVRIGMVIQPVHIPVVELPALFESLQDTYPLRTELAPRPTQVMGEKDLGLIGFRVDLTDIPPIPLIRFESADRSRWLEVQSDALTCGWKSREDGSYPAYESLRRDFIHLTEIFGSFWLKHHGDDELYIVQAGISYHNDFSVDADSAIEGLSRAFVLPAATTELIFPGLPPMRSVAQNFSFPHSRRGDTYAILRTAATVTHETDSADVRFNLRFWGKPFDPEGESDPEGVDATLRFMDEGHRAIVTAFDSATTPEMHKRWGRYHDDD